MSDTKEIYRGTELFTESVILCDSYPTTPAVGKLYIKTDTLEGKVWNGTEWKVAIAAVSDTVTADGTTAVSGKAVTEYVAEAIKDVTGSDGLVSAVEYVEADKALKVTMADNSSSSIPLTNLGASLNYDSATGALTLVDIEGTTLGSAINLDLERFVSEASYDHETGVITLKFNDEGDPLTIDIGDLVDTYTAADTTTVALEVTGNEFTAEVIVSSADGNMLTKTDNGLYVAATDISGKVDKVAGATANDIALLTAEGGLSDSGYTLGGSALGNGEKVLATEAAIQSVVSTLNASISTKMTKVGAGAENQVIIANADGDAKASGSTIGGAAFKDTPDAATLATEKGVTTYVDGYAVAKTSVVASGNMATTVAAASDEKVTSEKAVVEAMTWKTTV